AFRKHTMLPLDDCLYALQATITHLTRSSLHRLFQRHEISRLPAIEGETGRKKGSSGTRSATSTSISLKCAVRESGVNVRSNRRLFDATTTTATTSFANTSKHSSTPTTSPSVSRL